MSEEEEWGKAAGVCRGRVVGVKYRVDGESGRPVTRAEIEVAEKFRGEMPGRVMVEYPGGAAGGRGEDHGHSPELRVGDERVFFLVKNAKGTALTVAGGGAGARKLERQVDGKLTLDEVLRFRRYHRWKQELGGGEADLTPLAVLPAVGEEVGASGGGGAPTAGGLLGSSGIPARWVAPDRGEPIPYIVDLNDSRWATEASKAEALTAVSNALAAWTAATGIKFRFEGTQVFPSSAQDVLTKDEKIRIQLHDQFGVLPDSNTIAIGGREWDSVDSGLNASGGGGGQVKGLEFHKAVRGYVVLRSTWPGFSNLKTLEETLCHEIGHVLGLSHSSNNSSEPDVDLREAMMYYQVHQDNRGATLGEYDLPVVAKAHPTDDTPPWTYPRYMTAHTGPAGSPAQTTPGVNELTLTGYDRELDSASLTVVTGATSGSHGGFTFTESKVKFVGTTNPTNSAVGDPLLATYAKILYRYNDGQNCSPWQPISVIAFQRDTFPNITGVAYGDGMPDAWMVTHFGSASATGNLSGPNDDWDRDGLSNLEEYRLGTNPKRGASRFDVTVIPNDGMQWLARAWTLYALESSDDAVTWKIEQGIVPRTISGTAYAPRDPAAARRFLRLRHVR